jgi:hypothetical protein
MNDIAQIIASIATLVGVLGGIIIQILSSRKQHATLEKQNVAIEEVHKSTNGKMDKLLEVTGAAEMAKGEKSGHAAGLKEGREEAK